MGIDAEMFVRHRGNLSEIEVRQLAAILGSTFGPERFWIFKNPHFGKPRHALTIVPIGGDGDPDADAVLRQVPVWYQDGDPIVGEPGEQFIRVHLGTRYYGPGYERGDWTLIRGVAEFMEMAIPGGEVWYGGDSSGVCAKKLGAEERAEMTKHFLTNGHRPYQSYFDLNGKAPRPLCDFCAGMIMNDVGGGAGRAFYSCAGCGQKTIVIKGVRYDLDMDKDEDFFGFTPPPMPPDPQVETQKELPGEIRKALPAGN